MSEIVTNGLFWLLALGALVGAGTVALTRDVMRMALGLGVMLLALAGFFAYYGFGFLALAEVFVYVGGVLILVLFAIMLVHRTTAGRPELESHNRIAPILAAAGLSALLAFMLRPAALLLEGTGSAGGPAALSRLLLGPMLPVFEAVGALLLIALVAVVVVGGGERE